MANYISENDIEKACCEIIMDELVYDEHLNLWQVPDDGNAVFGRKDASEVVRLNVLHASLRNSIAMSQMKLSQPPWVN